MTALKIQSPRQDVARPASARPVSSQPVQKATALLAALVLCWVAAFAPRAMAQTFDRGHVDVFYVTSHGGELSL